MTEFIKSNQKVLFVWAGAAGEKLESHVNELKRDPTVQISVENIERLEFSGYEMSTFDVILSNWSQSYQIAHDTKILGLFLKLVKPNGIVVARDDHALESEMVLSGFVNVRVENGSYVGAKPNYEVGSAAKLTFAKKETAAKVWKLDDNEDEELINPDDLLDEEDKKIPDPSSLRVCGTTGKRKACKDCSCGLAEELESEKKGSVVNPIQKSSCGSCYLGDAFRCATCPYLGMPAFKPGEKIQITDNLMKADV